MKYGAFIHGAAPDAQKRQRKALKLMAGEGEVRWFTEPDGMQKRDAEDRAELSRCVKWCRTNDAVFSVSSISKLFDRKWKALTWMKHQVEMYDLKIGVADDPTISKGSVHVLSAAADVQRTRIAAKSKAALDSIKSALARDGKFTSNKGRTLTKLGVHPTLSEAGAKGNEAQAELAAERDDEVWPLIEAYMGQGMGYSGTARQLNAMGIKTPSERARHARKTTGEWYASTVRNIVLRRKK